MTATFIARRSDFILIGLPVLFPGVALLGAFYQKKGNGRERTRRYVRVEEIIPLTSS